MGTKYPGNADSGYNASPPPDDGSTGADNLVTWAKHKTKLTDPLLTYIDAINDDLNTWADNTPTAKAANYPTDADDNGRVIECTSTPTITLGAAATMGAGYEVTVKCVSGTTTVATGETIDGSASNRTITAGNSETYVVNNAASGYMIKQFTPPITLTNTVTMSNKTLTSPVINTGVSGTAIDTDTALAADSDTLLASQKATKAYVDGDRANAVSAYVKSTGTVAGAQTLSNNYNSEFTSVTKTATGNYDVVMANARTDYVVQATAVKNTTDVLAYVGVLTSTTEFTIKVIDSAGSYVNPDYIFITVHGQKS